MRPYLEKLFTKIGLVEWLEVQALSSKKNPQILCLGKVSKVTLKGMENPHSTRSISGEGCRAPVDVFSVSLLFCSCCHPSGAASIPKVHLTILGGSTATG
jgi:hypothetical protein